jgi:hypothetical protein
MKSVDFPSLFHDFSRSKKAAGPRGVSGDARHLACSPRIATCETSSFCAAWEPRTFQILQTSPRFITKKTHTFGILSWQRERTQTLKFFGRGSRLVRGYFSSRWRSFAAKLLRSSVGGALLAPSWRCRSYSATFFAAPPLLRAGFRRGDASMTFPESCIVPANSFRNFATLDRTSPTRKARPTLVSNPCFSARMSLLPYQRRR